MNGKERKSSFRRLAAVCAAGLLLNVLGVVLLNKSAQAYVANVERARIVKAELLDAGFDPSCNTEATQ